MAGAVGALAARGERSALRRQAAAGRSPPRPRRPRARGCSGSSSRRGAGRNLLSHRSEARRGRADGRAAPRLVPVGPGPAATITTTPSTWPTSGTASGSKLADVGVDHYEVVLSLRLVEALDHPLETRVTGWGRARLPASNVDRAGRVRPDGDLDSRSPPRAGRPASSTELRRRAEAARAPRAPACACRPRSAARLAWDRRYRRAGRTRPWSCRLRRPAEVRTRPELSIQVEVAELTRTIWKGSASAAGSSPGPRRARAPRSSDRGEQGGAEGSGELPRRATRWSRRAHKRGHYPEQQAGERPDQRVAHRPRRHGVARRLSLLGPPRRGREVRQAADEVDELLGVGRRPSAQVGVTARRSPSVTVSTSGASFWVTDTLCTTNEACSTPTMTKRSSGRPSAGRELKRLRRRELPVTGGATTNDAGASYTGSSSSDSTRTPAAGASGRARRSLRWRTDSSRPCCASHAAVTISAISPLPTSRRIPSKVEEE